MMFGEVNEPPFIVGLKAAKNLLLGLRERKVKELGVTQAPPVSNLVRSSEEKQIEKMQQRPVQQQKSVVVSQKQDRRQLLCSKINQIGKQLHDSHIQNQTYEVILKDMGDHYRSNIKIVEQNEKLKHQGYYLKQKIEQYKSRIRTNYQAIQRHRLEQTGLHQLTAQHLRVYLTCEMERGGQECHRVVPVEVQTKNRVWEREQQPEESGLRLRWQALGKQVVRKVVMPRKQHLQQQDIRQSFYHSQVYNL